MFKGAFRAFKEFNNVVNGSEDSWKSADDLSEKSAGQSSGNSAFIDRYMEEQGTSNILLSNLPHLNFIMQRYTL